MGGYKTSISPLPFVFFSGGNHLSSGVLSVNFLDDPFKDAVLVENECPAEGPHRCLAVHFLLTPCAEILKHLGGSVGQKSERKLVFRPESGVGLGAVLTYTHHVVAGFRQGRIVVPE